ncbi:MAG TPA: ankyrin repeat domain-containing protein [Nostocaceae cyanobacterium]|nr:ankyrin repeat domain-containing protein [Nostocaceae cyanobacterium]
MNISPENQLQLVEELEQKLGTRLPDEYRHDLIEYNVFTPDPSTFKLPNSDIRFQLFSFLGITEVINDSIWETKQMLGDSLPSSLIPIATLTNGAFICLGISDADRGKVFYYGDTQNIQTSESENIFQIAENFDEFIGLFDQEGDIDQLDENGLSLLHKAAGKGDVDEIEKLLGYGANIDIVTNDGYTPLFMAASEGKADAIQVLLEAGADTTITPTKSKGTPLQIACAQGHEEVVEVFLQYDQSLANESINNVTPLYIAAELGHQEVVNILLQYDAEVNLQPTAKSATPLYIATYNRHKEIVEILLKANADPDAGYQQATPLHAAAFRGDEEIVELLLEYGANRHKQDQNGKTPYDLAETEGHETVAKLLTLSQDNKSRKD